MQTQIHFEPSSRWSSEMAYLGVAVLGVAVLGVTVLGMAVLGVAVLWTAVLGVAVVGILVLGVTVLGVAVLGTAVLQTENCQSNLALGSASHLSKKRHSACRRKSTAHAGANPSHVKFSMVQRDGLPWRGRAGRGRSRDRRARRGGAGRGRARDRRTAHAKLPASLSPQKHHSACRRKSTSSRAHDGPARWLTLAWPCWASPCSA